jgi:hypothetical protein
MINEQRIQGKKETKDGERKRLSNLKFEKN